MSTIKSAEPQLWHYANSQPYRENKFSTIHRNYTPNPLLCQPKKQFIPDPVLQAKIEKTFVVDTLYGAPTEN
jgi:hypothetical protein